MSSENRKVICEEIVQIEIFHNNTIKIEEILCNSTQASDRKRGEKRESERTKKL